MGSGGFTIASNLGWFIEPSQAVELVLAIILLFRDEGPRESRTKCRLSFLLESWGLDRFRAALIERLGWQPLPAGQDARSLQHRDHLGVAPQRQPNRYSVGLSVTVGRIRHEALRELARLARVYGTGEVRLTINQNAILINVPQERLDALLREPFLKDYPVEPSRFVRGLVSCTGMQYCNLAVIETKARAVAVAQALEQRLGPEGDPLTIHWSGCPAACGNHLASDIGLRGMKVNVGGQSVDAVAIYVGGRTGPQAKAGQPIMEMVPCDEALPDVLATIIKHLDLFKQVEPIPGVKDRVLMIPAGADDDVEPAGLAMARSVAVPAAADLAVAADAVAATAVAEPRGGAMRACQLSELSDGVGRMVRLGNTSVALFRHDGGVTAVEAECPHEGGPLQDGTLEDGCVVCPWHRYRFDGKSGQCDVDPSLRVKVYPTVVEEGAVWVEVGG